MELRGKRGPRGEIKGKDGLGKRLSTGRASEQKGRSHVEREIKKVLSL